ncbi:hypothetical protein TRIUR3_23365 [Triticum urartu]|uniref:Uncharacterized protein n=1 Tax=Triticum urartu TaxID=4572 RepID=M7ZTZ6_TRIUA|nr:hypothetical protein TRIUR3_23365 [Triticum urartu]
MVINVEDLLAAQLFTCEAWLTGGGTINNSRTKKVAVVRPAVVLPSASSRALQQKKISYMICRVDISYYGWVNFEHKNALERYLISVITE